METLIGVLMIAMPVLIMAFFIVKDEIKSAKDSKELRKTQDELAIIKAQRLRGKFDKADATFR